MDAARAGIDQTPLWLWVPALAPPGSLMGMGQACAWWQGSKPCPAASKSFLLSAEHQLIRRMLELSFLALPKFILLRAVMVYF